MIVWLIEYVTRIKHDRANKDDCYPYGELAGADWRVLQRTRLGQSYSYVQCTCGWPVANDFKRCITYLAAVTHRCCWPSANWGAFARFSRIGNCITCLTAPLLIGKSSLHRGQCLFQASLGRLFYPQKYFPPKARDATAVNAITVPQSVHSCFHRYKKCKNQPRNTGVIVKK